MDIYIYIGVYEHRHGVDVLAVKGSDFPTDEHFMSAFPEIDWELDREDEWLNIYAWPVTDIRDLPDIE